MEELGPFLGVNVKRGTPVAAAVRTRQATRCAATAPVNASELATALVGTSALWLAAPLGTAKGFADQSTSSILCS